MDPRFRSFLTDHGIRPEIYDRYVHLDRVPCRYFTLNTMLSDRPSIAEIGHDLDTTVVPVPHLDNFYKVDGSTGMSTSSLYKSAHLFCMDLASALAVEALGIEPRDHVLDLCCAPGAKLALISMKLEQGGVEMADGGGTVTGVDISQHRLYTCRSLLRKYKCQRTRLFEYDGCTFDVGAPCISSADPLSSSSASETPQNSVKPLDAHWRLRNLQPSGKKYDKVMVDAECTHDGSIAHIIKYTRQWQDSPMLDRFLDPQRIKTLHTLQLGLLRNGFRLLSDGGVCVYSTCSFARGQNEDIIARFVLEQDGRAVLERVPVKWPEVSEGVLVHEADENLPGDLVGIYGLERVRAVYQKVMECSRRIYGEYEGGFWTSGLFIARIRKVKEV